MIFNVTGSTRQVFTATPNEYARMRFDGLNTAPYDFTRMRPPYGGDELQPTTTTGALDVQQGEAQHEHLHELSFEEANIIANNPLEASLSLSLLTRLPLHDWIQRAMHWMQI